MQIKAKRGDLIAVHSISRSHGIGVPSTETATIDVGVVTNITREGYVKHFRLWYQTHPSRHINLADSKRRPVGYVRHYIISQDRIDVGAALETAAKNPWPHNNMPGKHFESLGEMREALKPHLIPAVKDEEPA
jgi:hypothetical protein